MQRRRRKRVGTRDNPSVLRRATAIRLAQRKGRSKPEMAKMFRMSKRQIERYLALPVSILPWIDGRVITMAHARVLTDYIAAIPAARLTELVEQIRSRCLSSRELPRWLSDRGFTASTRTRGPRTVGIVSRNKVRFYDTEFSRNSPPEALQSALRFLREAGRRLEGFGLSRVPRRTRTKRAKAEASVER